VTLVFAENYIVKSVNTLQIAHKWIRLSTN